MDSDFYIVIFNYNQILISIQCTAEEKMKDVINKYKSKSKLDKGYFAFLYNGNLVNEDLTVNEIINNNSKNSKKIQILVILIEEDLNNNNREQNKEIIIKSKNIICPECKEDIRIKIKDYKIYLYECKNNHEINNISLNEFTQTQKIDLSKIICDSCRKHNKAQTYYNEFYFCVDCNWNICPFCKEKHNKNHIVIRDDKKNLSCFEHKESFIKYCNKCKLNLCFSCIEKHKEHSDDTIPFESIKPEMKIIKDRIQTFRTILDNFDNNINEIIKKIYYVKDNLEEYYKIYKDIIDNFDNNAINMRNYEIYQNLNEIKNDYGIINEIININENIHISKKVEKTTEIHDRIINKDINKKKEDENIKFITCQKCNDIPKITFLINNKVNLECSKCEISKIEDISYFNEYISPSLINFLPELSKCPFNDEHKLNAIKYCCNCNKFLCGECIKMHQILFKDSNHIILEQKVESKIYCNKENHCKNQYDRYCTICEDYLCPSCKCEHENENIFHLND